LDFWLYPLYGKKNMAMRKIKSFLGNIFKMDNINAKPVIQTTPIDRRIQELQAKSTLSNNEENELRFLVNFQKKTKVV